MRVQFGRIATTILAVLVMVQSAAAQDELTPGQDAAVNSMALTTWTAAGKVLDNRFDHCSRAFEKVMGRKNLYTPCLAYLAKEVSSAEFTENSNKPPSAVTVVPQWKAKEAAQGVEADAIALKVENGDRRASDLCHRKAADGYGDVGFANICINKVDVAYIKALRTKKFEPENCRQWGYANTRDGAIIPSIIRVSIDSGSHLGAFSGEITQIDGKTIVIYDKASRLNAVIILDNKTKIYDSNMVSVGLAATGIGIQTGSRQVKLATGQGSTVAVISAKCVEGKPNY